MCEICVCFFRLHSDEAPCIYFANSVFKDLGVFVRFCLAIFDPFCAAEIRGEREICGRAKGT